MEANKIVLITGVSRPEGIGFGLAASLAAQGFQVVISARSREKAAALAQEINPAVAVLALDITSDESVEQARVWMAETYGRLDVLVNNAGAGLDFGVHPLQSDFEQARQILEVNLFGAWRMVKAFHPLLLQSEQPRIVNVSSGAGSFSDPVFGLGVHPAIVTSYGISKLALNGLTVKLARQLKEDGILINAVCPGFVATAPGMTEMGARPVSEAVPGIIWAATLPNEGPTGGFFRDGEELSW